MCNALVAKNRCRRPRAAGFSASAARATSRSFARASEQIVDSRIASAMAFTHSKSPLELAAKPASITSTLSRSSCRAMRSFSSRVMEAPGDCSPSRKVVSKMMSLSVMVCSKCQFKKPATLKRCPKEKRPVAGSRRAVLRGMRARYQLRPSCRGSSSRASEICFMPSNISQELQCSPRSSGSSVEVLMTLVCWPLDLRHT